MEEKIDAEQLQEDARFKLMKETVAKLNEKVQGEQLGKEVSYFLDSD